MQDIASVPGTMASPMPDFHGQSPSQGPSPYPAKEPTRLEEDSDKDFFENSASMISLAQGGKINMNSSNNLNTIDMYNAGNYGTGSGTG